MRQLYGLLVLVGLALPLRAVAGDTTPPAPGRAIPGGGAGMAVEGAGMASPLARLQVSLLDLVQALVAGDRATAQARLQRDPAFAALRQSGGIAALHDFMAGSFPKIRAAYYPGQEGVEIVPFGPFVRADSFGQVRYLAKFSPTPALFSFTIYRPDASWTVLSMRFTNRAEQLADEAQQLLAEPPADSGRGDLALAQGALELERLEARKSALAAELAQLRGRLAQAQAFLADGEAAPDGHEAGPDVRGAGEIGALAGLPGLPPTASTQLPVRTPAPTVAAMPIEPYLTPKPPAAPELPMATSGPTIVMTEIPPLAAPSAPVPALSSTPQAQELAQEQAQGTVAEGAEAYRQRDYARAFAIWKPLAEAGHAKAQYHLAAMLIEGRLGPPDPAAARIWLQRSVASGYAKAEALLAQLDTV